MASFERSNTTAVYLPSMSRLRAGYSSKCHGHDFTGDVSQVASGPWEDRARETGDGEDIQAR